MFRRYWIAFAVFIGLAFSQLGQAQEQEALPSQNTEQAQQSASDSDIPLPVRIIEDQEKEESRERIEQEARDNQKADLIAQQGMDSATQRMANYARWQTWLIGAGTLLLLITLGLTFMANKAAQSAVIAMREIGAAELQPYPIIKSGGRVKIHNSATGMAFVVKVPIMNGGKSPMYDVKVRLDVYLWQGGTNVPPQANKIPEPALAEFACLAPDDVAIYPAQTAGTRDYISAVFNNEADWDSNGDSLSLAIYCTVISKDWHGQPVRTFSAWMAAKSPVNLKDYPPFNFEIELYHPRTNLERPAYL